MECYVGLDVHSKASVFEIQNGHGQVMAQGELPTTPEGFRGWREAQQLPADTPVALETGTVAFFVARELTALGLAPRVIDAREVGPILLPGVLHRRPPLSTIDRHA